MFSVSALIFCGLLTYSFVANTSCFSKVDYEFYMLQNLVEEVGQKVKFLKGNISAGGNTTCPQSTCPNMTCARQLKDLQEKCEAYPGGNNSTPLCQQCLDGWVSYNGSCYLFAYGHAINFAGAVQLCAQFDAVLVHVDNERENAFLRDMLRRYVRNNWWLGLTDQATEGDWRWIDTGKSPEYTGFSPGEPESAGGRSNEDCAGFYHLLSFNWVDVTCSAPWFPICEKW